jgi:8-oxo-dGTP pyrophosphatase MutT (NUDIX family)
MNKSGEYYVLPGGHRRKEENSLEAVLRELFEETGLKINNARLVKTFNDATPDQLDYVYTANVPNTPKVFLNGEEKAENPQTNFYEPVWVDLAETSRMYILPTKTKELILSYL